MSETSCSVYDLVRNCLTAIRNVNASQNELVDKTFKLVDWVLTEKEKQRERERNKL